MSFNIGRVQFCITELSLIHGATTTVLQNQDLSHHPTARRCTEYQAVEVKFLLFSSVFFRTIRNFQELLTAGCEAEDKPIC